MGSAGENFFSVVGEFGDGATSDGGEQGSASEGEGEGGEKDAEAEAVGLLKTDGADNADGGEDERMAENTARARAEEWDEGGSRCWHQGETADAIKDGLGGDETGDDGESEDWAKGGGLADDQPGQSGGCP